MHVPHFNSELSETAAKFWNNLWQAPHTTWHRAIAVSNVLDAHGRLFMPNACRHLCAWHANSVPVAFAPIQLCNRLFNNVRQTTHSYYPPILFPFPPFSLCLILQNVTGIMLAKQVCASAEALTRSHVHMHAAGRRSTGILHPAPAPPHAL
jgi:hypothetical protein